MILPTLLERPDLAPPIILKSIRITLQHGLSVLASSSFAVYAMFCLSAGIPVKEAKRFADLALILLQRYKAIEYLPRVYAAVYGCVRVNVAPLRESMDYLLEASRVGALTGDFEFAGLCANLYCFIAIDCGIPLDEILSRWQGFYHVMALNKRDSLTQMALPSIHSVRIFMGIAGENGSDFAFDYDEGLETAAKQGVFSTLVGIKFCRMYTSYMFGDYDTAFRYRVLPNDIKMMAPSIEQSSSTFYLGMLCAELARQKKQVRRNLRTAKTCLRCLRRLSRSCPENFADKVFFLEAELASLQKKTEIAFEKYVCAIGMAKYSGFIQLVGLANERLGWHLYRTGDSSAARGYWKEAQKCYGEWKAHGLVERMESVLQQNSK